MTRSAPTSRSVPSVSRTRTPVTRPRPPSSATALLCVRTPTRGSLSTWARTTESVRSRLAVITKWVVRFQRRYQPSGAWMTMLVVTGMRWAPAASSRSIVPGSSASTASAPPVCRKWMCTACGTPVRGAGPSGSSCASMISTESTCPLRAAAASIPAMLPPMTTARTGARRGDALMMGCLPQRCVMGTQVMDDGGGERPGQRHQVPGQGHRTLRRHGPAGRCALPLPGHEDHRRVRRDGGPGLVLPVGRRGAQGRLPHGGVEAGGRREDGIVEGRLPSGQQHRRGSAPPGQRGADGAGRGDVFERPPQRTQLPRRTGIRAHGPPGRPGAARQ